MGEESGKKENNPIFVDKVACLENDCWTPFLIHDCSSLISPKK